MEGRFEQLELNGRLFQVVQYPTVAEVSEIEDALEDFDYRYDPNTSTILYNVKLNNLKFNGQFDTQ